MIELFGSPAGRALTVNSKTSPEMQPCSKSNSSGCNSVTIATKCSSCIHATTQYHSLNDQRQYDPLHNCSFSDIGSITKYNGLSHPNACNGNFVECRDLIRHSLPVSHVHPQDIPLSVHHSTYYNKNNRTTSKIAKIWKLFDEDRINKRTPTIDNQHNIRSCSNDGSNSLTRCQRYVEDP